MKKESFLGSTFILALLLVFSSQAWAGKKPKDRDLDAADTADKAVMDGLRHLVTAAGHKIGREVKFEEIALTKKRKKDVDDAFLPCKDNPCYKLKFEDSGKADAVWECYAIYPSSTAKTKTLSLFLCKEDAKASAFNVHREYNKQKYIGSVNLKESLTKRVKEADESKDEDDKDSKGSKGSKDAGTDTKKKGSATGDAE